MKKAILSIKIIHLRLILRASSNSDENSEESSSSASDVERTLSPITKRRKSSPIIHQIRTVSDPDFAHRKRLIEEELSKKLLEDDTDEIIEDILDEDLKSDEPCKPDEIHIKIEPEPQEKPTIEIQSEPIISQEESNEILQPPKIEVTTFLSLYLYSSLLQQPPLNRRQLQLMQT